MIRDRACLRNLTALERHIALCLSPDSYVDAVLAFLLLNHFQVAAVRVGNVVGISPFVFGAVRKDKSHSLVLY